MAFTVQYHPLRSGRIRPYIGAGASYMLVFGTKDGAFQDLRVDDDLGLAFEAGSDFMVTDSFGIFADVKKAMLRPCPPTLNRMIVRNPPYLPAPRLATRCLNTPPSEHDRDLVHDEGLRSLRPQGGARVGKPSCRGS